MRMIIGTYGTMANVSILRFDLDRLIFALTFAPRAPYGTRLVMEV